MKAIVVDRYGPPEVAKLAEVPDPTPKAGELRIRVVAATVTSGDCRMRGADFPGGMAIPARLGLGFRGPRARILGFAFSGVVDEIGEGTKLYERGNAVFGSTGMKLGTHAEYVCMPETGALGPKPDSLTHEEAASLCFGGLTSEDFVMQRAKLQAGERLLVIGASGSCGIAAVQMGKSVGAHVTGVCSDANADFVRELGADEVIDYKTTDFREQGAKWDVIYDTIGGTTIGNTRQVLNAGGRLVPIVAGLWQLVGASIRSRRGPHRIIAGVAGESAESIQTLSRMVASGTLRPVIDSCYPMDQAAKAHARVTTGRKRGAVVLQMPAG